MNRYSLGARLVVVLAVSSALLRSDPLFAAPPQANLSIVVQGPTDQVVAGAQMQYTVTVTNQGPAQAVGVVATLTMPSKAAFVSATSAMSCTEQASVVTCEVAALDKNASATFDVTAAVAPDARGTLVAGGAVRSSIADPDPNNDRQTVTTGVRPEIDLQLALLDVSPSPAIAGAPLVYSLRVSNAGRSTATNVQLNTTLPTNRIQRFLSGSPGLSCGGTPASITCSIGTVAPAGTTAPGWITSGTVITVAVQLKASLALTETLLANIAIDGEELEAIIGNNFIYQNASVERVSDLSIAMDTPLAAVSSSQELSYTLVISNHGPSDNDDVVLTSLFPADALDTLTVATSGCTVSTDRVVCAVGTLPPGESTAVTIRGRAHSVQQRLLIVAAEVHGSSKEATQGMTNSAVRAVQVTPYVLYMPGVYRPR